MLDILPQSVFYDIQQHLRQKTRRAESGWDAGSDEEDTLTGDFGASLRTDGWIESRNGDYSSYFSNGSVWRWKVSYKKFRGRGPNALESKIGADGIFRIEITSDTSDQTISKGIIFQAKKHRSSARRDLVDQIRKMEEVAPNGSAVFEYSSSGYRGESGADILTRTGDSQNASTILDQSLGFYLAERFLTCQSGLRGMYFDAIREKLIVPVNSEEPKIISIRLDHRISIDVEETPTRRLF